MFYFNYPLNIIIPQLMKFLQFLQQVINCLFLISFPLISKYNYQDPHYIYESNLHFLSEKALGMNDYFY